MKPSILDLVTRESWILPPPVNIMLGKRYGVSGRWIRTRETIWKGIGRKFSCYRCGRRFLGYETPQGDFEVVEVCFISNHCTTKNIIRRPVHWSRFIDWILFNLNCWLDLIRARTQFQIPLMTGSPQDFPVSTIKAQRALTAIKQNYPELLIPCSREFWVSLYNVNLILKDTTAVCHLNGYRRKLKSETGLMTEGAQLDETPSLCPR